MGTKCCGVRRCFLFSHHWIHSYSLSWNLIIFNWFHINRSVYIFSSFSWNLLRTDVQMVALHRPFKCIFPQAVFFLQSFLERGRSKKVGPLLRCILHASESLPPVLCCWFSSSSLAHGAVSTGCALMWWVVSALSLCGWQDGLLALLDTTHLRVDQSFLAAAESSSLCPKAGVSYPLWPFNFFKQEKKEGEGNVKNSKLNSNQNQIIWFLIGQRTWIALSPKKTSKWLAWKDGQYHWEFILILSC